MTRPRRRVLAGQAKVPGARTGDALAGVAAPPAFLACLGGFVQWRGRGIEPKSRRRQTGASKRIAREACGPRRSN